MSKSESIFDTWENLGYQARIEGFVRERENAIMEAAYHSNPTPPTSWEIYAAQEDAKTETLKAKSREKINPSTHPVSAANFEIGRTEDEAKRDLYWDNINMRVGGGQYMSQYGLEMEIKELREGFK